MKLSWENYGELADALEEKYPQEDLLTITSDRLIKLVNTLPDFDDSKKPEDEELIDAVIYAWISLGEEPNEDRTPSWA